MHKDMRSTFGPLLSPEGGPYHARSSGVLDEQYALLEQRKAEITNMLKQVKSTYKSITYLLDLKQKQANIFTAVETVRVGGTLMVFTIVTIIFLPLSFLAAFFAIALEGLPYNSQDRLPLTFILKYVVGVGLGTALASVFMARHHRSAVRWLKRSATMLDTIRRWTWLWLNILVFSVSNLYWSRVRRDSVKNCPQDDGVSGNLRGSDQAMVSPTSSGAIREQSTNLPDDLERGSNGTM
jgi:hypothetical protein